MCAEKNQRIQLFGESDNGCEIQRRNRADRRENNGGENKRSGRRLIKPSHTPDLTVPLNLRNDSGISLIKVV